MVGLFNLYHEHIRRSLAAECERDNLAVQAEQSAAQIQVVEVVERLHNRAGLALKIALACTAVQVAPVDVERECVLDVFPGHILVAPAALIGGLEAVDEVALALQLFAGQRAQLFREVDIIVTVLAVMRERELARTNGFDTLNHRLSDRNDDERDTTLGGILLQRIQRRAEVALTHRRKIALVSAVQRRHFHQHKAVFEADLRIVVAAPHEKIDKAALTQMIVVMRAAVLDHRFIF